jgi:hypothetical protein
MDQYEANLNEANAEIEGLLGAVRAAHIPGATRGPDRGDPHRGSLILPARELEAELEPVHAGAEIG